MDIGRAIIVVIEYAKIIGSVPTATPRPYRQLSIPIVLIIYWLTVDVIMVELVLGKDVAALWVLLVIRD